jgi:queuine tRNA-ribosyltransferase
MLGRTLLSLHNLTHLIRFTAAMATAIGDGSFAEDFAPWEPGSQGAHTW